jgi:hypothetical protein
MNWTKLAVRAYRLGTRFHGKRQFLTESFIYGSIPVDRYESIEVEFNDVTGVVKLTTPELKITLDGLKKYHKVQSETDTARSYESIDELIYYVREYYREHFKESKFALN